MSYVDVDPTMGLVLDKHAEQAAQFAALSSRLKAADGDRAAALNSYISTSDDPQVVKLRNGIEKLQTQLNELAEKNVVSVELSAEDREALSKELDKLKTEFRDGRKAILSISETLKATVNVDSIREALEKIGDLTKGSRGRKVGDPGSSLPKASAILKVSNANDTWTFDTFGLAAKHMGIPVEKLQVEFARSAGVPHLEIASVTTSQEFSVQGANEQFTVKTTPKERKKPGPRPGGNKAAA